MAEHSLCEQSQHALIVKEFLNVFLLAEHLSRLLKLSDPLVFPSEALPCFLTHATLEAAKEGAEEFGQAIVAEAKTVRFSIGNPLQKLLFVTAFTLAAGMDDFLRVEAFHEQFIVVEFLVARYEKNSDQ